MKHDRTGRRLGGRFWGAACAASVVLGAAGAWIANRGVPAVFPGDPRIGSGFVPSPGPGHRPDAENGGGRNPATLCTI